VAGDVHEAESRMGLLADIDRVLVVGAGRSGLAAAGSLLALSLEVVLSDTREAAALPGVEGVLRAGALLLPGPQSPDHLAGIDLVIKSPGVPGEIPLIEAARSAGIPVWSEVELAYALLPAPFSAVTGTNGKTTTTALLGHMFQTAGRPVRVLGNIGTAITSVTQDLADGPELVVELSSFQLEDVHAFRPAAGVLLNLTPDHLDRHGTMERYLACKANMFVHQGPRDWAVFNLDDPAVADLGRQVAARVAGPNVAFFSAAGTPGADAWYDGSRLHLFGGGVVAAGDIPLRGLHNMENCLGASTAALVRGVPREGVEEGLRTFPGVPHRLEPAGVVEGVAYVNDSKATNVEATLKALGAYPEGTHLILGGRDKASDYRPIARACGGCRGVYLLGEAAPLIAAAFEQVRTEEGMRGIPVPTDHGGMEKAVAAARAAASVGETVLLAPACASFDQYSDFEDRGRHFVDIVRKMRAAGE
jgi:UDP-N-acetylmuramoylalanine--D-glutamate ligase